VALYKALGGGLADASPVAAGAALTAPRIE